MELEIALALPFDSNDALRDWLSLLPNTTFERTTQLLNVYFDTPNQDLKKHKTALRLRFDTEQSVWIQTLKTAGSRVDSVHVRQEWEQQLPHVARQSDVVPDFELGLFAVDAQNILKPFINDLKPVFHTDFTREIYQYSDGEDEFELAFDLGQVRLLNGEAFTPIFELEIEYKKGDIAHLRELALKAQTDLNATPQFIEQSCTRF